MSEKDRLVAMIAWTDYPILALGDESGKEAPIRQCTVLAYDRDKYCYVEVDGVPELIKHCYIYVKPGRCGKVKVVPLADMMRLPEEIEP